MIIPRREKPGRDVGSLATEDLAQVSELPERDLVLDSWDVVKLFSDGGVIYVLIDDLTRFDAQSLPNTPVQNYFEGIKKNLPESPTLASPQQKITWNGPE